MPNPSKPSDSTTLSSKEVVEFLAIKPATLYAYVARGWVRAVTEPGKRTKRYLRSDIEQLKIRSQAHAGQGAAAAAALHWGVPLITTKITDITSAGPVYRGLPVLQLVERGQPFENTAEFLWTGIWQDKTLSWSGTPLPIAFLKSLDVLSTGPIANYPQRLATLFQLLGECTGPITHAESQLRIARQSLIMATGALAYLRHQGTLLRAKPKQSMAKLASHALAPDHSPELISPINLALTLGADHELPPSTFVARVIASTGGSLHSALAGACSAFYGVLSGTDPGGLEDLIDGKKSIKVILKALEARDRQGRPISGLNHPLYPQGDPRATYLLNTLRPLVSQSKKLEQLFALIDACKTQHHWTPSFHAGLLAIQFGYQLPHGTAAALNLLGRLAGTIAHFQEQQLSRILIRPRAKYMAG